MSWKAGAKTQGDSDWRDGKVGYVPQDQGPRTLHAIAQEIRRTWKNVYFGAVPYLDAMLALDSIQDNYGADSGRSVVVYFLANAATWRGSDAKRIKAELKSMTAKKGVR